MADSRALVNTRLTGAFTPPVVAMISGMDPRSVGFRMTASILPALRICSSWVSEVIDSSRASGRGELSLILLKASGLVNVQGSSTYSTGSPDRKSVGEGRRVG